MKTYLDYNQMQLKFILERLMWVLQVQPGLVVDRLVPAQELSKVHLLQMVILKM